MPSEDSWGHKLANSWLFHALGLFLTLLNCGVVAFEVGRKTSNALGIAGGGQSCDCPAVRRRASNPWGPPILGEISWRLFAGNFDFRPNPMSETAFRNVCVLETVKRSNAAHGGQSHHRGKRRNPGPRRSGTGISSLHAGRTDFRPNLRSDASFRKCTWQDSAPQRMPWQRMFGIRSTLIRHELDMISTFAPC